MLLPDCAATLFSNAPSWLQPAPVFWIPVVSPASCSAGPFTCTVNDLLVLLPAASVAVQVTVVSPIGKLLPDRGVQPKDATPALSVALAAKVTLAPAGLVASAVTSEGVNTWRGGGVGGGTTRIRRVAIGVEDDHRAEVAVDDIHEAGEVDGPVAGSIRRRSACAEHVRAAEDLHAYRRAGGGGARRSTASIMAARGERPEVIQRVMRHAKVSFTLDRYVKVYGDDIRDAVQRNDARATA